jgi:hypothetical protein
MASVAAALATLMRGRPRQDEWNDKTILRFTSPAMVPGAALAPGEYVFQIADSRSDRNLIQILNNENLRRRRPRFEASSSVIRSRAQSCTCC